MGRFCHYSLESIALFSQTESENLISIDLGHNTYQALKDRKLENYHTHHMHCRCKMSTYYQPSHNANTNLFLIYSACRCKLYI